MILSMIRRHCAVAVLPGRLREQSGAVMRIRVNLLPHRAERRERQKKAFLFATALSLLAGATLVFAVWSALQHQIAGQRERNEFITAENRKLDTADSRDRNAAAGDRGAASRGSARSRTCRLTATSPSTCWTNWPARCLTASTCARSSRRTRRSTSPDGRRRTSGSRSSCATCRATPCSSSGPNWSRSASPASSRPACSAALFEFSLNFG
jgi:hypothetical protein